MSVIASSAKKRNLFTEGLGEIAISDGRAMLDLVATVLVSAVVGADFLANDAVQPLAPTAAGKRGWTTPIAPGVHMPWVSLGSCCGSDPAVGVAPWLHASAKTYNQPVAGIDTAFDYNDQKVIAARLAATRTPRESVFITTKIKVFITTKIEITTAEGSIGFSSRSNCL